MAKPAEDDAAEAAAAVVMDALVAAAGAADVEIAAIGAASAREDAALSPSAAPMPAGVMASTARRDARVG